MPDSKKSAENANGDAVPGEGAGEGAVEKLSTEDLARVERYLQSPIHQVQRKPFRPWMMMLLLLMVVGSLSLLSLLISRLVLH